jgi:hypothetical protein
MNCIEHVFDGVVDYFVLIISAKAAIRHPMHRSRAARLLDSITDKGLQRLNLGII